MINSKQHPGCRIQDPGTRGKHQTENKIPGVPAGGVQGAEFRTLGPVASIRLKTKSLVYQQGGCRVQNSGPWDPWLPVVENSGQRAHSAWCAPLVPRCCRTHS